MKWHSHLSTSTFLMMPERIISNKMACSAPSTSSFSTTKSSSVTDWFNQEGKSIRLTVLFTDGYWGGVRPPISNPASPSQILRVPD
eukprot:scaffold234343_cov29-Tisochrysis_lutea.AAC.1